MAYDIQQSTTQSALMFLMVQSSDHITGLTGASPTVTLSKNGGSFASPSGAVSEVANGWYKVAGNATDTGTLGPLTLHATAASGDPCDIVVANIVAFNPQDAVRLGLTALPNAAAEAAGGLYTRGTGAGQIKQTNNGEVDANVTHINNVATTAVTTIKAVQGLTTADTIVTYTGNTLQTANVATLITTVGTPAGVSVSADIAAVKVDTAAVKVQTDKLTFTVANQVDCNPLSWKSGTIVAPNVTGVPKVDIVDWLGSAPNSLISGRVDSNTQAMAAGVITSTVIAASAITSSGMATSCENAIADALLDRANGVDGSLTPRSALKLIVAAMAGQVSGAATTTVTIKDTTASISRIVATVDANGNRSAVVYDLS